MSYGERSCKSYGRCPVPGSPCNIRCHMYKWNEMTLPDTLENEEQKELRRQWDKPSKPNPNKNYTNGVGTNKRKKRRKKNDNND